MFQKERAEGKPVRLNPISKKKRYMIMATKTTKKASFSEIKAILEASGRADLAEVMAHELELLAKKNASGTKKPTAQQKENAEYAAKFLEYLGARGEAVAASEVMAEYDLTSQRMSAIMSDLIDAGEVVKSKVKGKVYYALPAPEADEAEG